MPEHDGPSRRRGPCGNNGPNAIPSRRIFSPPVYHIKQKETRKTPDIFSKCCTNGKKCVIIKKIFSGW
jgi:hypothetical protein